MKYKENVIIFDSVFLITKVTEITSTYLQINNIVPLTDTLYVKRVIVKKVLLKVFQKSLSTNFGVIMVCDLIDDTEEINKLANIVGKELESVIWLMCKELIGLSVFVEMYVDIIIMGHNLHIVTTKKIKEELYYGN